MAFVADLDLPQLHADDHHHLARVLRVGDGDTIMVSDGRGRWRPARFGATLEPVGAIETESAAVWPITVAFTPVKGDRPEWIVQKLTELGVDRILVITTERSVVRWDETRRAKQEQKWRRTVREAAMQSRQVRLPVIESVGTLEHWWATEAGAGNAAATMPSSGVTMALADPDGAPLDSGIRTVFIGPEGGWSPRETADRPLVSLPGGVLRAETAALVAATMLAHHRVTVPDRQS